MVLATGASGSRWRTSGERAQSTQPNSRASLLLAFLLLAAARPSRAGCPYNLTLDLSSVSGLLPAYEDEGWCLPFAAAASTSVVHPPVASCGPINVPPGTVISFGTCALPGASCTGTTALQLQDTVSGALVLEIDRVSLTTSVASLDLGCVLGHRCSYGEWLNTGLTGAALQINEGCYGLNACTGVVAWQLTTNPQLLPALAPSAASSVAFKVVASAGASLTGLAANIPAGATVAVWSYPHDAITRNALGSQTGWTQVWSGTWPGPTTQVALSPAVALAARGVATLLVSITAGGTAVCANSLGGGDANATLYGDGTLTVMQGVVMASPSGFGAVGNTSCALGNLQLGYTTTAACPPSPPPPVPLVATSVPQALVNSLDDLLRALANPLVTTIQVNHHILLNGTQLAIATSLSGTRTVVIEGTNGCDSYNGDYSATSALCTISAGALSRVLQVDPGVTVSLRFLQLRDGVAPPSASGGCVFVDCTNCSVKLRDVRMTNCSAVDGAGGALASLSSASLSFQSVDVDENLAMIGGGVAVYGTQALVINASSFTDNTATGSANNPLAGQGVFNDLPGVLGGAAALFHVNATIKSCTVEGNSAATQEVVLMSNPALPQSRGGGFYIIKSVASIVASTFSNNVAGFGGALYVDDTTTTIASTAVIDNEATEGYGGGIYSADSDLLQLTGVLVTGNTAGGSMGGGVAVLNATVIVSASSMSNNSATGGCGGAMGLSTYATLTVQDASVFLNNMAMSGGAICCDQCFVLDVLDSYLHDNQATTGGGGAISSSLTDTALTNVSAVNNTAPQGGAVFAGSSLLNLTSCTMRLNSATSSHGGAVSHSTSDDDAQPLNVVGSTFDSNSAVAAGGGLASLASLSASITNTVFNNNHALGPAPAGGGFMSLDVPLTTVDSCTFSSNWVQAVSALNSNAALVYIESLQVPGSGNGGAIWAGSDDVLNVTISNTAFIANWAASAGGLYLTGGLSLVMTTSTFTGNSAEGNSAEGGALKMDANTNAWISQTTFSGGQAVRGGAGAHNGASQVWYSECSFNDNQSVDGDDTKGSAIFLGEEAANVVIAASEFLRNSGTDMLEGTVAMGRSPATGLQITDTVFDGNVARLGAGFLIAADSQLDQLACSNVTFRNQVAYIGGVMYSESANFGPLDCSPVACDWSHNNSATDYGQALATPPKTLNISLPTSVRSGAPLTVTVSMNDGFGQRLVNWDSLVATIETDAHLTGSLRSFYSDSAAVFSGLALYGAENTTYTLTFTMTGPDLYGNDITTGSENRTVQVQACQPGETFNNVTLACQCATAYGLVLSDHTCRLCAANEVVPSNALSCTSCPDFSEPVGVSDCQCIPGYFGNIENAVGACTQCPSDSYRSAADPPDACRSCPATSHTFSPGATSVSNCLCATNFFNDVHGGENGSFACVPVPVGGWAPQADSRLFALDNYWRPDGNHTQFFECSGGMCFKETPPTDPNVTQLGYKCRAGHTGHLCAVCQENWAYQGTYCRQCRPGQQFHEWSKRTQVAVLVTAAGVVTVAVFLLFLLPLFPRTEAMFAQAAMPAVQRMERLLGDIAAQSRPMSAGSRPTSAAARARRISHAVEHRLHALQASAGLPPSRPRYSRHGGHDDDVLGLAAKTNTEVFAIPLEHPTRVQVLLETLGQPVKIIISFWQIVSSFSNNLAVPWPSVYYSLASSLSVTSLQFLRLPQINCIQPQVSFFTVFNITTLSFFGFAVFALAAYFIGSASAVAKADKNRQRRFKARVLKVFWWGAFFFYPQVASTSIFIFVCTPLEDNTQWLMQDYRIQCWTSKHRTYVGLGVLWTILFAAGIPASVVFALWASRVPELAQWKRRCAWLRAIVQRSMVLGIKAPGGFNPDTLTPESITLEHLQILYTTFVEDDSNSHAMHNSVMPSDNEGGSGGSSANASQHPTRRQLLQAVHASAMASDEPDLPAGSRTPKSRNNTTRLHLENAVPSRRGSQRLLGLPGTTGDDTDLLEQSQHRRTGSLGGELAAALQDQFPAAPAPRVSWQPNDELPNPPRARGPRRSALRISIPGPEETGLLSDAEPIGGGGHPADLPSEMVPSADPPNSPVRRRASHAANPGEVYLGGTLGGDGGLSPDVDTSNSDEDEPSGHRHEQAVRQPRRQGERGILRSASSVLMRLHPHPHHAHPHPPPPSIWDRLEDLFQDAVSLFSQVTLRHTRSVRRAMSGVLFTTERERLVQALLDWAWHDMQSSIPPPAHNAMRWRARSEWDALRGAGVELNDHDTAEQLAHERFSFLFVDYGVHAWWWECVDNLQKLFLTSIISFVAPRSAVQVIVACMFAFAMVLFAIQVMPYKEGSSNQLLMVAQINIFLFLFMGLLLQTNPGGITSHQLVFSIFVGSLATSIVAFSMYLFAQQLMWQLLAALYAVEDEELAEEEEELEALEKGANPEGMMLARHSRLGAPRISAYHAKRMSHHARMSHSQEVGLAAWVKRHKVALLLAIVVAVASTLGAILPKKHHGGVAQVNDVTRYTLVISRGKRAGFGDKMHVLVNGSIPGPPIRVAPNSIVEVTVINTIPNEDSAIHWHGMFQKGTSGMDGVPSLTQCPIPPNGTMVYRFNVGTAGTYWYHGHWRGQYTDGLIGPLVVDDGGAVTQAAAAGDARAEYDADTWNWLVHDYYEENFMDMLPAYLSPASQGNEPVPDSIGVNGQITEQRPFLTFKTSRATRQRVRVVNAAGFSMYNISVDGVPLSIVELDATTVAPHDVPYILLNVAQRASFVLDFGRMATKLAASPAVYFRVQAMPMMYPTFSSSSTEAEGVFGTVSGDPLDFTWLGVIKFTDSAVNATVPLYDPANPPHVTLAPQVETNLVAARPYPPSNAPNASRHLYLEIVFQADENGVNRAYFNGESWKLPPPAVLARPWLLNNTMISATAARLPGQGTELQCTAATGCAIPFGEVIEFFINNTDTGEHPIHLHGHEFWIVATSEAPDADALYAPNYLRRDVVSIPAKGWARIRFAATNPGAWFMHCHIEWHMAAGLNIPVYEAPDKILSTGIAAAAQSPAALSMCGAWSNWYNTAHPLEEA